MTICSELDDYEWLTGEVADRLMAEAATWQEPLHRAIERLRRQVSPRRAALVVELVELRRRAVTKFARAGEMYFTRVGLEQATDEWVAAYIAARFPAGQLVADLCCGIGGNSLALAKRGPAIGVDRNAVTARHASANVRAILPPAEATRVDVRVSDVEEAPLGGVAAWHIDPDRRPVGRRTTSVDFFSPNLEALDRMLTTSPNAAIKLAPASRLPNAWTDRCELEWISRGGECRQLVAWHGALAKRAGERSATIVCAAPDGFITRSIAGKPKQSTPIVAAPNRFVFDVDPAVLAAHLKGAIAAEHGLSALSAGATYLTGPKAIADAALDGFEVLDVLPLDVRSLASELRERGIGRLEIKKRGVEIDPDKLRRTLKLRGDQAGVLIITPVAGHSVAILGRRATAG